MIRYLKLVRITAWPALALVFFITFGAGANGGTDVVDVIFGFASVAAFASFVFALNFYSDRDTDRQHDGIQKDFNLATQPLVTGEVKERECRVFCILTFLLAIIFGFLVNNLFGLLVSLACLFGGILYSHPWIRLKAKPLGDVLCIASVGVLIPSAGHLLSTGVVPDAPIMIYMFLLSATFFIATVISDWKFDLAAGLRTSAVFLGQSKSLIAMVIVCVLSLALTFLIIMESYPLGTKLIIVVFSASSLVFTMVTWKHLKPPHLHMPILASHGHWVFMFPGIATLLFAYYAFYKIITHSYISWDPFLIY